MACAVEFWIPVCPAPAVITVLLGMKASDSGHHVVGGAHGLALEDRLETSLRNQTTGSIFKKVSARLKLFPLWRSRGAVWIAQATGLLAFSVCLPVCLSNWLVVVAWPVHLFNWMTGMDGSGSASSGSDIWLNAWLQASLLTSFLDTGLSDWLTGWLVIISGPSFSYVVSSWHWHRGVWPWQSGRCAKTLLTEIRHSVAGCSFLPISSTLPPPITVSLSLFFFQYARL